MDGASCHVCGYLLGIGQLLHIWSIAQMSGVHRLLECPYTLASTCLPKSPRATRVVRHLLELGPRQQSASWSGSANSLHVETALLLSFMASGLARGATLLQASHKSCYLDLLSAAGSFLQGLCTASWRCLGHATRWRKEKREQAVLRCGLCELQTMFGGLR